MFVDELAKLYMKFEQIKPSLEKVAQKQKHALEQLNQAVYITDLIVRTPFDPFGEANNRSNNLKRPSIQRLEAYILTLFTLANEYHGTINCEIDSNRYQLKKDKKNHITRLSTHEFSFYTSQPLSLSEFQLLVKNIELMANKLTPNVHVLLSSFAVRSNEGILFNISIFVEGGESPELHVFCKNTAASNDVTYTGIDSLFSQQQTQQPTFHADKITAENGFTMSTGSVFEVKTKGGACYTQAIDICLDHALQHSKELIIRRISSTTNSEILPEQIEHCVSSNSIPLYMDSLISDYCTHIDPITTMQQYEATLGSKTLTNKAFQKIIPSGYPNMKIMEKSWGYQIMNPPFGSECYIEIFSERPAGKYLPEFQSTVHKHNEEAHKKQLKRLKQEYLGYSEQEKIVHHIDQSTLLSSRIEELEKKMLKRCKPTILQELFKTEELQQKEEAKAIIRACFKLIKEAIKNKGNASVLLLRAWKQDLASQINAIGLLHVQSPLKKGLIKDMDELLNGTLSKELGCSFERGPQNR